MLRPVACPSGPVRRRGPLVAAVVLALSLTACTAADRLGTAWGDGSFDSNGERIYFTGTSERDGAIDYTGGVDSGGMMMGGRLSCASCHGVDARGGEHTMHMQTMDAPSIRWVALSGHGDEHEETDDHEEEGGYDLHAFRAAVVEGRHPDGDRLSEDMPRWDMSEDDLRDLAEYLQSFEGP